MDFANSDGPITPQHYAFLITEAESDAVLARIKAQGLDYWADTARRRPREINRNDGGRGVYFPDPDGQLQVPEAAWDPRFSGPDPIQPMRSIIPPRQAILG